MEEFFNRLRRSKKFGASGAPCRPLTRESGVDREIDEVVVEPLSLTPNALSPETQPLGYGATLLVFGRTQDDHPVQAEFPEGVLHQRPARSGNEPITLILLTEPVAHLGATVLPVDGAAADNPRQATLVPDAGREALAPRELLESTPYEVLAILEGAARVHPREPRPQMLAVAVGQVGELPGVPFLEQAQLRVSCEHVAEHPVCPRLLAASRLPHPTAIYPSAWKVNTQNFALTKF
jgi:hypothetical protein